MPKLAADSPPDAATARTLALLDEALAHLPQDQRAAVLLRHLEGKSIEQTAHALNLTPAVAGKRAVRGIERLRRFFARRGVPLSAAALLTLFAAESANAAPAALLATLTAPSAGATALAHLTSNTLLGVKMKIAAALSSPTAAALAAWAVWPAALPLETSPISPSTPPSIGPAA
jgi:hypothetical protein